MRKDQLSEKQLKDREMVVAKLKESGWEEEGSNRVFEMGEEVRREARMKLTVGKMIIYVGYEAMRNVIHLTISQLDGKNITVGIEYQDKLSDLLEEIVVNQDMITLINWKQFLGKLLKICPKIYKESEDGDWILIVDG